MEIAFDKQVILITGATARDKLQWQRVFLYNYATGELLGAIPVADSQYLNFAGIDPTGSYAVMEVRDAKILKTVGARIFDVAKKTYTELVLPR
jgi:hypothetical protein